MNVIGLQDNVNLVWDKMFKKTRKVAKRELDELKGFGLRDKESCWWDEEENAKCSDIVNVTQLLRKFKRFLMKKNEKGRISQ